MDNIIYNEHKKVSFKTPIFILTLIAIVCSVIPFIPVFSSTRHFPIDSLVYLLFGLVPYALLLLITIKQTKKIKTATLLCVALLVNTAFNSMCDYFIFRHSDEITLSSIVTFLFVIAFSLVCVSILRGVRKKAFTIIVIVAMIAYELYFLLPGLYRTSISVYIVAYIVSLVAFYAAIILFVAKNNVAPASCIKNTNTDLSGVKRTKRIISIIPIIALFLAVGAKILRSINADDPWFRDESIKKYSLDIYFMTIIEIVSLSFFLIFFAIFLCGLYKKIRTNIAIPMVLGGLSTSYICIALDNMFYRNYDYYMIYGLFFASLFIFTAIMNRKNTLNPSSVLFALCAVLPEKLYSLPSCLRGMGSYSPFLYIAQTIDSLAWILLAFALVAYMANRHLFEYDAKPLSPQEQLLALKNKFEFGVISQEEYQSKRAEIINNL